MATLEALRASEERYRQLFENMTAGFALHEIICDAAGHPIDYRFLEANPAYERLTGMKAADIIGRTVREIIPLLEGNWIEKFGQVALTGKALTYENHVREFDRYYDTFSFSPRKGQFAVVFHEVTERRRAQNALVQSEARYRHMLDTMIEGVIVIDVADRISFANPAIAAMLGHTPAGIVGRFLIDFMPPALHAKRQEYLRRRREGISDQYEFELLHKNGSRRKVRVAASPLRDDEGNYSGTIAGVEDITDRVRLEEEQTRLEGKLLETQKLESLGVLAGGIAHDFNNILSGVLGNANLARLELQPGSVVHPYLEQIEKAAVRAADLCKQMLAYSGRGRFIVERLALNAVIEDTLQLLNLSISKNTVLKLHLTQPLPAISADATQLRQLIMNLVINASEALEGRSGVISLTTGVARVNPEYLSRMQFTDKLPMGDYIFLEVSDNGSGMTKETLARIFDPFFTTKFSGRGLGLSAVLGIVRGHRGGLKVYSEPGRGTTFKILFPIVEGAAETAGPTTTTIPEIQAGGTVLVVDDEETVCTMLARALERFGFKVELASNGQIAVEKAQACGGDYRLVLLDLTMPHMDGEATFSALRNIRPDLPVLLMSGFNENDALSRFGGKGLSGFLQKPFDLDNLRQKLVEITG
jgi:PAS domain S-box-containing protein